MRVMRDKRKNRGSAMLISLAVVAALALVSFGITYFLQYGRQPRLVVAQIEDAPQDQTSAQATPPAQESVVSPPIQEEIPEDDEPPMPSMTFARERMPGAIEPSHSRGNAYFEDAIFLGDSISTGITIYQVAGSPATVAAKGASPYNILTDKLIATPDGDILTVLEAAALQGDKAKVYIMIGSNGLWMDDYTFESGYRAFLSAVREQYPEAIIYLQSIPPVTAEAYIRYPEARNDTINRFNEIISSIAAGQNRVYFVDIAQALVDEEGNLPMSASPTDGIHFTPEFYQRWFNYLMTHTATQ